MNLQLALSDIRWQLHQLGDTYTMDGKKDLWKIAYYPIFGFRDEVYSEPRALVERPIEGGIDFREVPLRYLSPSSPDLLGTATELNPEKQ